MTVAGLCELINPFLGFQSTPLIKVTATDLDEGVNKDIIYEMIDGNRNLLFQLNPTSGQLYLARDLELNDAGTYTVVIEVRICIITIEGL